MDKETLDEMTLDELIDKYMDQEDIEPCFEGSSGLSDFMELIKPLKYETIEDFLSDNPGAIEAMLDWVGETNLKEWKDKYKENIKVRSLIKQYCINNNEVDGGLVSIFDDGCIFFSTCGYDNFLGIWPPDLKGKYSFTEEFMCCSDTYLENHENVEKWSDLPADILDKARKAYEYPHPRTLSERLNK